MEMKTEYNFGFKKDYNVTLFGDQCGRDRKALEEIISSYSHSRSLLQDWQKYFGKPTQIVSWLHISEKSYQKLIGELKSIAAEPEVCEFSIYKAFEDKIISQDFSRRYANHIKRRQHELDALNAWLLDMARFKNDWWSRELSKLREYAFGLWAEAENIDEAYRLTLLPSFNNSQVIRIWLKDNSIYFVHIEGMKEYDCEPVINKNIQTFLDISVWKNLKQFMDEYFWTAETWYGRGVNDGMVNLFEGWKDGQYKVLDDHSPEATRIPHQAWLLFEKIKTQAISSLGNSE